MIPQARSDIVPGKLVGVVLDPLRAIIPGATITIRGRGFRREFWCSNEGTYSIDVPSGTYRIRIKHPGFLPFRRTIHIRSNNVTRVDVALHLNPRLFGKTWIVTKRG